MNGKVGEENVEFEKTEHFEGKQRDETKSIFHSIKGFLGWNIYKKTDMIFKE